MIVRFGRFIVRAGKFLHELWVRTYEAVIGLCYHEWKTWSVNATGGYAACLKCEQLMLTGGGTMDMTKLENGWPVGSRACDK